MGSCSLLAVTEPKVAQLEMQLAVHGCVQDVFWLEIAVDDAFGGQKVQRSQHVGANDSGCVEMRRFVVPGDQVGERAVLQSHEDLGFAILPTL
jgi:hypothetical protein